VTVWVAEDFFVDAIAAIEGRIGELIGRNSGFVGNVLKLAMPLFLREITMAVGDDEALVPSASLIDSREIDLVKNSMAEGVPDSAVGIEGRANARFGARSPARRNARPAGRKAVSRVGQLAFIPRKICTCA
jgi:hypothetical protein